MKAEKNRQKAEEMFLKAAHTQRQELAQQRREERKRAEKERLMAEEDPDRARKLEVCALIRQICLEKEIHLHCYVISLKLIYNIRIVSRKREI